MTQTKTLQRFGSTVASVLWVAISLLSMSTAVFASPLRDSAVVRAVRQAQPSVVNIHGQKLVRADDARQVDSTKHVNGMGSGVVIDGRGYILTNFHVVDGVRRIRVTLANGQGYTARLVAHDPGTDLAIIKLPLTQPMVPITIGSSRDIMTGETVIAVGNAYGYEHTVTTGIVSAQHRNVQVNDTQNYYDLIQTDASINPGNSGGPLLNVDGEMIGLNVAVRVGAQGIGFAIPVDRAMQVAAKLMNVERLSGVWHGVVSEDIVRDNQPMVIVSDVKEGSPAFEAGVREGDVIKSVAGQSIARALDVERSLLDTHSGESVRFAFERGNQPLALTIGLVNFPGRVGEASVATHETDSTPSLVNDVLGIQVRPVNEEAVRRQTDRFRGGLLIESVEPNSLAARKGIQVGDVLVGIHQWETVSLDNLDYILTKSDFEKEVEVPFYILRQRHTLSGNFPVRSLR